MAGDAFLLPEDRDEEEPNLTKESFNLNYGSDGGVEAYCGSGISLVNPLYSFFCEHVVDASILPPGIKSFTCPHKGCGEVVPRCDTRELSLAEVHTALVRLHPKPARARAKRKKVSKGNAAGGGKKRPPATPSVATRRSQRTTARQKWPVTQSPPTVPSSTVSSSPPRLSPSSSSTQSSDEVASVRRVRRRHNQPVRNSTVSPIVLGSSDDQDSDDGANHRSRRQGRGTRLDPIIID